MSSPTVFPFYSMRGGATQITRGEAQAFARKLLNSQDYRDSLESRIKQLKTDPRALGAMEPLLWHYAFGKPIEQVQMNVNVQTDLSSMSLEDLLRAASQMTEQLKEAVEVSKAIPADILKAG